uniref:Uncharacterized protein n=1 Tax=Leersia perrieri TaxID=77586 RepID=A0A0D9XUJ5_9ORYZ
MSLAVVMFMLTCACMGLTDEQIEVLFGSVNMFILASILAAGRRDTLMVANALLMAGTLRHRRRRRVHHRRRAVCSPPFPRYSSTPGFSSANMSNYALAGLPMHRSMMDVR